MIISELEAKLTPTPEPGPVAAPPPAAVASTLGRDMDFATDADPVSRFEKLIARSLQAIVQGENAERIQAAAGAVNEAYKNLPRSEMSRDDLMELKFMAQKWRRDVSKFIPLTETTEGPRTRLPIKPVKPSRWPFERWSRIQDFKNHRFDGDTVFYRDVRFRPGDLLVCNGNTDSNGIYTAPVSPVSFASHMGIFAVLCNENGRFPAVIEIYQNGCRAIPLSVFLEARFMSYAEVYRLKEIRPEDASVINETALRLTKEIQGYNFFTDVEIHGYTNCAGVFAEILKAVGIEPITRKSFYDHPKINDNMAVLDFHCRTVSTPLDFVVDPRAAFQGVIDNGHFDMEISRYVAVQTFMRYFSKYDLNVRGLPPLFFIYTWAMGLIRRRTFRGRLILFFYRFTENSFPKGPARLVTMVEVAIFYLRSTVKKIAPLVIDETKHEAVFKLKDFFEKASIKRLVQKRSLSLTRYFHTDRVSSRRN